MIGARGDGRARLPAPFTVVVLVVGLAGLVAVASHGAPVRAPLGEGQPNRSAMVADIVVLIGLGMLVAAAIAVAAHGAIIARRPAAPPLGATLLRALPITTAVLAALSLLTIARTGPGRAAETGDGAHTFIESSGRRGIPLKIVDWWWDSSVRAGEGEADPDESGGAAPDPGPRFPYVMIVIGVVVSAFAGATAWRWHSRRAPRDPPGDDDDRPAGDRHREAVHGAVVGTIDAMLADPDPSTAIRGAYARLLEGLAACGAPRRDHEAPMEHLHRVLATVRVRPGPSRRLIELFEVARFSTHPLTGAHRAQALDALRVVATDIAAFSAPQRA